MNALPPLAPGDDAGHWYEELLAMTPAELDALDNLDGRLDGPAGDHPYSYRELEGLGLILTPRVGLLPADRAEADRLAAGADQPNPDTPWVKGDLITYREWRRLFTFDEVARELLTPARVTLVGVTPHAKTPRQPPADAVPKGPQLYAIETLIANPDLLKPREPVAAYVAYPRALVLLWGREKLAGKSTLLTGAVAAVINGKPFLNTPTMRGPVLWVTADRESAGDIVKRALPFGADHGLHVLYPRTGILKERLDELEDAIRRTRPVWVIVDTLANYVAGVVEKSSSPDEWPIVLLPLRRIMQQYNVALTLVHHSKKDELDYRDSTAIGATVDMLVACRRHKTQATWRELAVVGRWTLPDATIALADNRFRVVEGGERASVTDAGHVRQRILDALDKGSTAAEVAKAAELSPKAVRAHLRDLEARRLVTSRKEKRGRQRVTLYRRVDVLDAVDREDVS